MEETADKIIPELDNPIDAWLLAHTARVLPALRASGHTPNTITTYSFACGLLAVWFLRHDSVIGFAVFFAMAYIFDCLDGQYARRYGMTSHFGDIYDHVTDLIVYGLIAATVFLRFGKTIRANPLLMLGFGVAALGLSVNIGCQQRLHNHEGRPWETLDAMQFLCPCHSWVHWSRFTGYATFNILTVATIACLYAISPPTSTLWQSSSD